MYYSARPVSLLLMKRLRALKSLETTKHRLSIITTLNYNRDAWDRALEQTPGRHNLFFHLLEVPCISWTIIMYVVFWNERRFYFLNCLRGLDGHGKCRLKDPGGEIYRLIVSVSWSVLVVRFTHSFVFVI